MYVALFLLALIALNLCLLLLLSILTIAVSMTVNVKILGSCFIFSTPFNQPGLQNNFVYWKISIYQVYQVFYTQKYMLKIPTDIKVSQR